MLEQHVDGMHIDFAHDKFVIVGLGLTGLSVLRYLHYKQAKILAIIENKATNISNSKFARYEDLITSKLEFDTCNPDVIVLSPGVSLYTPLIRQFINRGIRVIGDIELFALAIQNYPTKIIAITGSNGKTTVTTLINHLINSTNLTAMAAGNIGLPALDCYLDMIEADNILDVIVLELSSFQLESTYSLTSTVATVLNISEDHLDRYPNLLTYAYVKSKVFKQTKLQIINFDDPLVKAMAISAKPYNYFSHNSEQDFYLKHSDGATYLYMGPDLIIAAKDLNILGEHNYLNVLVAVACVNTLGIKTVAIQNALTTFKGLDHRMQKVLIHKKITFIDDSKGTNVGAVVAGISGLTMPIHLILGGDAKAQDFYPLIEVVRQQCKSVAIIGKDATNIYNTLVVSGVDIKCYSSMNEAVAACITRAIAGDCVLLSPACSSLDMFDNYIHRSQVFIESIHGYI